MPGSYYGFLNTDRLLKLKQSLLPGSSIFIFLNVDQSSSLPPADVDLKLAEGSGSWVKEEEHLIKTLTFSPNFPI